ncbi:MAG: hypothetical protein GDA38_02875 [Hormoscilla sp. SP12CHS1]|nr:hypothetical protein [Hormoscilla sp. SP12CHS1]
MGKRVIADLTVEELKALIAEVVDERLQLWQKPQSPKESRSAKDILSKMDKIRMKSKPREPTLSQIIIEERNKWREVM